MTAPEPEQDDVSAWLQNAARNVRSSLENAQKRVHAAASSLQVADGLVGHSASQLPPVEEVEAIIARVRAGLQNGGAADVARRDRRFGCAVFQRLTPSEVRSLLSAGAREWRVFVDALFSQRQAMDGTEFRRWAPLLERAPRDLALFADKSLQSALLEPDSAYSAARLADHLGKASSLTELLEQSTGRDRLSPRWEYTSTMVAMWLLKHAVPREQRWEEIKNDIRLEAMLLPRARDAIGSVFAKSGKAPLPPAIPDNSVAQAAAVSALLLQGAAPDQLSAETQASLREIVFRSSFRDPREFRDARYAPESVGWKHVRALAPLDYEAFLERLISEDMQVFFEYIETDQDRGRFWQRLLKHICGTGFFLSDETKERLSRAFAGGQQEMRARIKRTNRLLDQMKGDAFYLMFKNHVVVEFSQKGNAAFVYERQVFEKEMLRNPAWITNLKRSHNVARLTHHQNWQQHFCRELEALGVYRVGGI